MRWLFIVIVFVTFGSGGFMAAHQLHAEDTCATCVGAAVCKACKSCKSCKHCAKEKGTCGTCKPPKKEQ